jgi:hypothetical protein
VIAKIPKADARRFEALLQGDARKAKRDSTVDTFREIILSGLDGVPAARDLPELVLSAASDYLLCSEADLERNRFSSGSLGLETTFGVKETLHLDFFPASAYRGPWIQLLRSHHSVGLNFLVMAFNHCAEWYAHPRVPEHIEPPHEIELIFADGTSRKQWGNPRLWNWYRGTSVGPYVLQSLLMGLELWLFEFAEAHPTELDTLLIDLLRRSDSAALTAVVASVATGNPHGAGETLLVLLRSPAYIWFDRQRMANESQSPSRLSDFMPGGRAENKIYEEERKGADARPHRRYDLEMAITNLQLGPLATRVHEILDQHRNALPPVSEQNDEDRLWRLSIHRMDLRQYSVAEATVTESVAATDSTTAEPARRQIRLDPNDPEPDVKKLVEENAAKLNVMNARIGLLMWALKVFKNEEVTSYDPDKWRQKLIEARSTWNLSQGVEDREIARGGPGIVAAVCIRDHWQEMSRDEQDWCVGVACHEVMLEEDAWNHLASVQNNPMSADRACASVIPLLVGTSLPETQRLRVQKTFVVALTHTVDEVRWSIVWGIGREPCPINRELRLRCVNALATEAILYDTARGIEAARPYDQRREFDILRAEAALTIRQRFWQDRGIAEDAYQRLNDSEWFGAETNGRILAILSGMTNDSLAIAAFTRAAQTLGRWWDLDEEKRRAHNGSRRDHSDKIESAISQIIQRFVMQTSEPAARAILQPLVNAVDSHPSEVHWAVHGLTSVELLISNTQRFWFLWELFAVKVRNSGWLSQLETDYPFGAEMISAMFLGSWWPETLRHWKSLEGYAQHLHTLFEDLPPCSVVLDDYVRFLYQIGEQSLPLAFIYIARRLQSGTAQLMLKKANTVFMLEVLLQRHVYGKPLELKRDPAIRQAVLLLLDLLVEHGSSAAFRMRDDFVTPNPS